MAADGGGATGRVPTVLLVSDHGDTGGTRAYVQRMLRFYRGAGWPVLLLSTRADVPLGDADVSGVRQVALAEVLGPGAALRSAWAVRGHGLERAAFARFAAANGVSLVVASVGTPGALLTAVQAGHPSLYILHTYPHGRRARLLGRLRFRHALDNVTATITVSDAARRELVRLWGLGAAADRVSALHSTVGPVVDDDPRADAIPDTVLALGHVERYKGPDVFVEMARVLAPRFVSARFVWAGDGSLMESCRARVHELGLADRVEFPGHVDDVSALYARTAVYVQPSRVESLGLALLDAGRHGVPSVVPAVGGMPELVADRVSGRVVPDVDATALADAVGALLSDQQERERLGRAARLRYAEDFSEAAWMASMARLHERLIAL